MHISLRPNEKIYINGAVLKVDRKVSIELLNDAVFLLEAHVMLEKDATTPLKKLYFIVQLMLIEPQDLEPKRILFNLQILSLAGQYKDPIIQTGLSTVSDLINRGRVFEALKLIRSMLPIEAARPESGVTKFERAGSAGDKDVPKLPPVQDRGADLRRQAVA